MDRISKGVLKIIHKFEYPMYAIYKGDQVCPCVDFTTKEADRECDYCLGIGTNIRIEKIKGLIRDNENTLKNVESPGTIAYVDGKYKDLKYEDYLIDGDNAYSIHKMMNKASQNNYIAFKKALLTPIKLDKATFMRKFKQIVGE